MLSVKSFETTRLQNKTLCRFFEQIEELIKQIYGTETCPIAIEFLEASQAYELAFKGCGETQASALQNADDQVDEIWGAMNDQIRASLRHPNPQKRAAAAAVFMVFGEFSNPTRLNYDEEYTLIREQIDALRKLPPHTLEQAYIHEHVDALEACYNHFVSLLTSIKSDSSAKKSCKREREAARDAFRAFSETINVMNRIGTDERIIRLTNGLNEIIDKMTSK
ncbi:MAG: hypothetical protein IJM59_14395 [Proteobacteria bacterium]|nr:hypothetical protein [Pseudomonadota bacterium]